MSLPGRDLLLDILKGSVATLVLFLAFVSLPIIGLVPGLFAPLPAMYYSLKGGRLTGIVIVLITAVVLTLMGERSATVLYLMQCGCLSLLIPWFLGAEKGAARALAYSVAICLAVMVAVVLTYASVRGINVDRQVVKGIEASIAQTATFYEKAGLKGDDLRTMRDGLAQVGHSMGRAYPAMVIICLILVAGSNMLVLSRIARALPGTAPIGSFHSFKNPEPLVWGLIAAGFAMLIPEPVVTRVALNALLVILFMYFIQGLAVAVNYFQRLSVPRFARILFYVVLAIQPYLAVGLAVVGIFDIWGDFRSPRQPKNL